MLCGRASLMCFDVSARVKKRYVWLCHTRTSGSNRRIRRYGSLSTLLAHSFSRPPVSIWYPSCYSRGSVSALLHEYGQSPNPVATHLSPRRWISHSTGVELDILETYFGLNQPLSNRNSNTTASNISITVHARPILSDRAKVFSLCEEHIRLVSPWLFETRAWWFPTHVSMSLLQYTLGTALQPNSETERAMRWNEPSLVTFPLTAFLRWNWLA